jgi:hypothetical protein
MNLDMENAAIELDQWLRFAGLAHLGYISTAVGVLDGVDTLIIYWDKVRMNPGGMPETFASFPVKIKRTSRPVPAAS